jgi:hypothetical protein
MMRNIRPDRFARCALLLALLASTAAAAAPQLYDVEVIVFTRDAPGGDGELAAGTAAPGQGHDAYVPGEFTELSSGAYRLNNIRGGLSAARGYHVLLHRAWRQPGLDRAQAVDYPVHAQTGSGSIDGTVTLILERYLHLDVDLRLVTAGGGASALYPAASGRPAYRLTEKRRIRSNQLHYFDHPRFGVIARVTPYESPEAPAAADAMAPDDAATGGQEEEPVTADEQPAR